MELGATVVIPNRDRAIGSRSNYLLPIATKNNPTDLPDVRVDRPQALTGIEIPDFRSAIKGRTCQQSLGGTAGNAPNPVLMSAKYVQTFSRLDVPQSQRAIHAAADNWSLD
jgi:hypothetical protein